LLSLAIYPYPTYKSNRNTTIYNSRRFLPVDGKLLF
jgi:hypothetical protein